MKHKKLFVGVLSFLLMSVPLFSQQQDIFAEIAAQKRTAVPGMVKNPAPVLPDIILNWDSQAAEAFLPMKKITTQQALETELKRMRKQFAPFMKNHAPQLPVLRKQQELKDFQWRLLATEMSSDEKGNLTPLPKMEPVTGPEQWESVTIPHYTGPINKAEAIYRKELNIDSAMYSSDKIFLHFNGVDYLCEIYVNGKKVGGHVGVFGAFEFDIKPFVKVGANSLEVKIFNDALMMGDNFFLGRERKYGKKLAACGGPGWDEAGLAKGWIMCPPGFGIWQRCYLEARPTLFIHDVYVRPLLNESKAEVCVEVSNTGNQPFELSYSLFGQNFKSTLFKDKSLDAASTSKADTAGIVRCKFVVDIPKEALKVWSLDEPWLYQLQVEAKQNQKTVDAAKQTFGMRSFVQSETSTPKGRFYLNGKEVKLRGANMMGNLMQCVIRNDYDQLRDDILLAKIVGMNFWRMTQQPCQPEVYDYFDQLGLMAQSDMPAFYGYRKDCIEESQSQFVEMMKLVRNHPCNIVVSYCNEPILGKPMFLNREEHEELFHGFDAVAAKMNPGQVTKWIDGDYSNLAQRFSDHHSYNAWYGNSIRKEYFGTWLSTREGWMHGCGEFGTEGLERLDFMNRYYPPEWLQKEPDGTWRPNRIPRCQSVDIGRKWLKMTQGPIEEVIETSREFQMWATRLFTESLRRDAKMNSFAIHLLIDAWPSNWLKAIMDTERYAKPAFFAYLDALRPVAVNLRPDRFYGFSTETATIAVFVCNDLSDTVRDATLKYQIEFEGKTLSTGKTAATVAASNPTFQGYLPFTFPEVTERKKATVRVGLFDVSGKIIHESSYDFEIFPLSDKGKKLNHAGGYPQRLIR